MFSPDTIVKQQPNLIVICLSIGVHFYIKPIRFSDTIWHRKWPCLEIPFLKAKHMWWRSYVSFASCYQKVCNEFSLVKNVASINMVQPFAISIQHKILSITILFSFQLLKSLSKFKYGENTFEFDFQKAN